MDEKSILKIDEVREGEKRKFKFATKDLLLLNSLRENSRKSLTSLSKQTKIPVSTLFDRLKLLEKEDIIRHTLV